MHVRGAGRLVLAVALLLTATPTSAQVVSCENRTFGIDGEVRTRLCVTASGHRHFWLDDTSIEGRPLLLVVPVNRIPIWTPVASIYMPRTWNEADSTVRARMFHVERPLTPPCDVLAGQSAVYAYDETDGTTLYVAIDGSASCGAWTPAR